MLVGRKDDLDDLRDLIGVEPLVLLKAPWGYGKTTLLRALLREIRKKGEYTADLANLQSVQTAPQLLEAISNELGLRDSNEKSIAVALGSDTERVLLLDHCDELNDEALEWIVEGSCRFPHVTFVAAARSRSIGGALVFGLPSLRTVHQSPEKVSQAAAFFIDSTQRRGAWRERDKSEIEEHAQTIAELLDGHPAMLAFAADLTPVLSPDELCDAIRVQSKTSILSIGNASELVAKFETLQWAPLPNFHRDLLARLALHAEGIHAQGTIARQPAVLEALASLESKSLVAREGDRFVLGAATTHLVRHVDAERTERAKSIRLRELCDQLKAFDKTLHDPDAEQLRAWFDEHEEELLQAWQHAIENDLIDDEIGVMGLRFSCWRRLVDRPNAQFTLDALQCSLSDEMQQDFIAEAAWSAADSGRMDTFSELANKGQELADKGGSVSRNLQRVLNIKRMREDGVLPEDLVTEARDDERGDRNRLDGVRALQQGQLQDAVREFEIGAKKAAAGRDGVTQLRCLMRLGRTKATLGEIEAAQDALARARELASKLGAHRYEAIVKLGLAETMWRAGALVEADRVLNEICNYHEKVGNVFALAAALSRRGDLQLVQGNAQEAKAFYRRTESLRTGQPTFAPEVAAHHARTCALATFFGDPKKAKQELKAAQAAVEAPQRSPAHALDVWSLFVSAQDEPKTPETDSYEAQVALDAYRAFQGKGVGVQREALLGVSPDLKAFWTEAGNQHRFKRDTPMSRIAKQLFRSRLDSPSQFVSEDDLLNAGWPGERFIAGSDKNRLWVTLSRLRNLGLGDALQKSADGYRLNPDLTVRVKD